MSEETKPAESAASPIPDDATSPAPFDRREEEVTLQDKIVSAALWGAGVSFLLPTLTPMTAMFQVVPSHKMDWFSRFYCGGQMALTGNRWRAVVDPAVDPDEQYIFAQNHTNHFDHIAMYNATPHFKQGLELETHFKYPFYGWFMKARGTIPVPADREKRTEAVRRGMKGELDAGRSVLAFPEGTRTLNGRVGQFRRGVFFIARDLGVKVVPTTVTGMYDVMHKGSLLIRPGNQVTVYCDAPVDFAGLSDEEVELAAEEVRCRMIERVNAYFDQKAASTGEDGSPRRGKRDFVKRILGR